MPIQVVCPGCLKRFKVSDKFAGQSGPCPNCKQTIQIPELSEQVVIHEPEQFSSGGRARTGRMATKPIFRQYTRVNPAAVAAIVAGVLVTLIATYLMGRAGVFDQSVLMRAVGLMIVSPPIVMAGYWFLSDSEELEVYRGRQLFLRATVCSLLYIAVWGAFGYAADQFLSGDDTLWEWLIIVPFLAVGGSVALGCFDLDFGTGFLHYCFYVFVTVVLRAVAGLGWIWNIAKPPAA